MNAQKTTRLWGVWIAVLLAAMLGVAGCGGGGGGDNNGPQGGDGESESAGVDFTLTSFARGNGSQSQSFATTFTGAQPTLVDVAGDLLAVNVNTGEEEVYHYNLRVDASSFSIGTDVAVDLPPGTYDLYFLLQAYSRFYAGTRENQVIQSTGGSPTTRNRIPFTLNPVIAADSVSLDDIRDLVLFRFRFDTIEIGTFTDPVFSIGVNGAPHEVFSINTATGLDSIYVLLPPGHYVFAVHFYDASSLKLVATVEVDLPTEGDLEAEVTPILTEVLYTYTPTGSPTTDQGDVTFVVPAPLVTEGGGLGSVLATAAVVGPLTPLVEDELSLLRSSDGTVYTASLPVPGLTAGPITWSIQFRDTRDGDLYAFCAEQVTVDAPVGNEIVTGRFICEPRMIARGVSTDDPPAPLNVLVTDPQTNVSGAVITANDVPIGITSGTGISPELLGQLEAFLPADTYWLKAKHEQLDPYGSGEIVVRTGELGVGLVAGTARDVTIPLGPLAPPAETCLDGSVITSSRTYSPSGWLDGSCEMSAPLLVTLTESFQLSSGAVGTHWARLYLENLDGSRVVCLFQGDGETYRFHHCYDNDPQELPPQTAALDLQLGSQVLVDQAVRLRVNGDAQQGPTVAHYTLAAMAPQGQLPPPDLELDPGEGEGEDGAPGPDGGDEDAAELETIMLTASRQNRPRRFFDAHVKLSGWAKVRLPGHDRITVSDDKGDPERFLMIVYFGRGVKCWYLGGQWDSAVGGYLENLFHETFSSPACNKGKQAGDTIWVRGPIRARVIAGSPRFNLTEVNAEIPVVAVREGADDSDFDPSFHNRRGGWRWWWWPHHDD